MKSTTGGGHCIHDLVHFDIDLRDKILGSVLRTVVQAVDKDWVKNDIYGCQYLFILGDGELPEQEKDHVS